MRFKTLEEWLQWQMDLHDRAIDLGLERVREVGNRLGINRIADTVITVAGTNGKGSTVAAYETWLKNAGFSVASYTSPHLLRYNERVRRNGLPVEDADLCAAFEAVEQARGEVALTYFEFGTLAALHLMQTWQPDYAILEVGLGGRLDAVNIVDADLVHLTPIGIDHQNWLGDTREKIGREKAGVLRAGIPVVVNDPDPPQSVLAEIERLHCLAICHGKDFFVRARGDEWLWCRDSFELVFSPELPGRHQVDNLAGVLAGLSRLLPLENYSTEEIRNHFKGMQLAGRFQQIPGVLQAGHYIDVGHNQDAARVLAENLADLKPAGRCIVLLGMLDDKRADLFVETLAPAVDGWWLMSLPGERGLDAAALEAKIDGRVEIEQRFESADEAYACALSSLGNQDIILVCGSFVTVETWLHAIPLSDDLTGYGSKH